MKEEFVACRPDVVLLDINLPRYDGFYWCRQLRTISKVPIIFISARSDDFDQVRALENGGDDYITKPFNLELAVAKIQSVIRRTYGEYALGRGSSGPPCGRALARQEPKPRPLQRERGGAYAQGVSPPVRSCGAPWADRQRDHLLEALWDDVEFVDDNTLTVNVTRVGAAWRSSAWMMSSRQSEARGTVSW